MLRLHILHVCVPLPILDRISILTTLLPSLIGGLLLFCFLAAESFASRLLLAWWIQIISICLDGYIYISSCLLCLMHGNLWFLYLLFISPAYGTAIHIFMHSHLIILFGNYWLCPCPSEKVGAIFVEPFFFIFFYGKWFGIQWENRLNILVSH